jgi:prepilin-type N-terminal cleavage/methylation domain-containing protein
MKNKRINKKITLNCRNGFSLPELLIVLFVIGIIVVLALPQIISSRRLFRFSGMQRQIVASLREARQEAMSQRAAVTFRYDDANKKIVIYGGSFGPVGNGKNRSVAIADEGLQPEEVVYGRPSGAPVSALADGSSLTSLSSDAVEITFQADGSVVDARDIPVNKAVFFYNSKNPVETAFAVSVLGAGGRAKVWRYSQGVNAYVE